MKLSTDSATNPFTGFPAASRDRISVDDTSIRQVVADNARLPQLDLRLQAKFSGLNNNFGEGYVDVVEGGLARGDGMQQVAPGAPVPLLAQHDREGIWKLRTPCHDLLRNGILRIIPRAGVADHQEAN